MKTNEEIIEEFGEYCHKKTDKNWRGGFVDHNDFIDTTSIEYWVQDLLVAKDEAHKKEMIELIEDYEVWRPVDEWEDSYEVSNCGRIKSKGSGLIRKQHRDYKGYLRVTLKANGRKKTDALHRIIAKAFLPKKQGDECVNHKNGIKFDNRISNLEWCTKSEDVQHAYDTGLMKK